MFSIAAYCIENARFVEVIKGSAWCATASQKFIVFRLHRFWQVRGRVSLEYWDISGFLYMMSVEEVQSIPNETKPWYRWSSSLFWMLRPWVKEFWDVRILSWQGLRSLPWINTSFLRLWWGGIHLPQKVRPQSSVRRQWPCIELLLG